jgi:hypothetical protein
MENHMQNHTQQMFEACGVAPKANVKHTPGPWTRGGKGLRKICRKANDIELHVLAIVEGDDYTRGCAEIEANACLIAAAPEMLEALKEVADFIEKNLMPMRRDDALGRMIGKFPTFKVKAVIATAEGAMSRADSEYKVFRNAEADNFGRYERWGWDAGKAGCGGGYPTREAAEAAAKQAVAEFKAA